MVTFAEITSEPKSRQRFLRSGLGDFGSSGPGFGWADMTEDQWANMTVDQWANMPVSGNATSFNVTYTYDPAGNRITENNGTVITTLTYSPANRLQLANAAGTITTYTVDAAGNRTAQISPTETIYYAWDAAGNMATAEPAAGTVTLTYNADQQRAAKQSTDGAVTGFLYDYKRLLCETDTVGGAISQNYASDTTEEFGDLIGEDGQYIHQYDAQANTNALLDDTGTVQAQYKYLAFGQVSAVSIDGGSWTAEDWESLPLDFTSNMLAGGKKQYYLDQEIALYLLGSGNNGRYYDATTGRFLSEDPTGEAGGDDNLFRYTGNDPVNNLDPSGHKHQPPPKPVYHPSQDPSAANTKANATPIVHTETPTHGTTGHMSADHDAGSSQSLHQATHNPAIPHPVQPETVGEARIHALLRAYELDMARASATEHTPFPGPGLGTFNTALHAALANPNDDRAYQKALELFKQLPSITALPPGQQFGANHPVLAPALVGLQGLANMLSFGLFNLVVGPQERKFNQQMQQNSPAAAYANPAGQAVGMVNPVGVIKSAGSAVAKRLGGKVAEDVGEKAPGLLGKIGGWIKGLFGKTAETGAGKDLGLSARFRQGSQGQLESAFAKVEPKDIGTGSSTTPAARTLAKRLGNTTDEAGHAIGKNLGGPGGATSGNIFPQVPSVNRGALAQFEQQIARRVQAGDQVYVRVVPRYAPGATRPYEIAYQVRVNGVTTTRVFPNR